MTNTRHRESDEVERKQIDALVNLAMRDGPNVAATAYVPWADLERLAREVNRLRHEVKLLTIDRDSWEAAAAEIDRQSQRINEELRGERDAFRDASKYLRTEVDRINEAAAIVPDLDGPRDLSDRVDKLERDLSRVLHALRQRGAS